MAGQTVIAAFFFNIPLQGQKTVNYMLRSAFCRILMKRGDLVNLFMREAFIYGTYLLESPLSWPTLKSAFEGAVQVAPDTKFILLLDALDECMPENGL
ncbi:hypothetical protein J3459_008637 [Metarhizium acridum]|nr:hypothetical protein J3459_008637 [Metarhizium acridum]